MLIHPNKLYHAIIIFLAEDLSHGYVRVIDEFNHLSKKYINNRSNPSFIFHTDKDFGFEKFQIVQIKIPKGTFHNKVAKIESNIYAGFKKSDELIIPIGLNSFLIKPDTNDTTFDQIPPNSLIEFFLSYNLKKNSFYASDTEKINDYQAYLNSFQLDLNYYFNHLNYTSISILSDYLNFLSNNNLSRKIAVDELNINLLKFKNKPNPQLSKRLLKRFSLPIFNFLDFDDYVILAGSLSELIKLWIKNEIPEKAINEGDIEHLKKEDFYTNLDFDILIKLFLKFVNFKQYDDLLVKFIKSKDSLTEAEFLELNELAKKTKEPEGIIRELYKLSSYELLLKRWLSGDTEFIPQVEIITNFKKISEEDKIKIINKIGFLEYAILTKDLSENSKKIYKLYAHELLIEIGREINYCCFDLEVNPKTNKIDELAYKTPNNEEEYLDPSNEIINEIKQKILSSDLVIGHNIRRFDLVQLFEAKEIEKLPVWDTLEIETIINPTANSYALKTHHEALSDVHHCLNVFLLQLQKVNNINPQIKKIFTEILPKSVHKLILDNLPLEHQFDIKVLNNQHLKLYHIFDNSPGLILLKNIKKNTEVVICPKHMWYYFSTTDNIHFTDDSDHNFNLVLNEELIKTKLRDFPLLKASLLNFVFNCQLKGHAAYSRLLSGYITQKIYKIIPIEQIGSYLNQVPDIKYQFYTEWYFNAHKNEILSKVDPENICFFGLDFWKFISQHKLIELSQEELDKNEFSKELWVNFSNGMSTSTINKELANELAEKLTGNNFWLTKTGIGNYSLFENFSDPTNQFLIKDSSKLNFGDIIDEYAKNEKITKPKYLKIVQSNRSNFIELNPETLYRDTYWESKLKIFHNIYANNTINRACILLISKKEEVPIIAELIRKLNIYVPRQDTAIRRRMELVVKNNEGVIIETIDNIDKIMSHKQAQPFSFLLENLKPYELLVSLQNSREGELKDSEDDSNSNEDKEFSQDNELNHFGSVLNNFDKLSTYYDWFFTKILIHNNKNEFVILDPRGNYKILDKFNLEVLKIDGEKIIDSENKAFRIIADECKIQFYSPREFEIKGEIQEHFDNIAAIFLKGKGNGEFKKNQKDYLKVIFPGKEDVLVTLPTGEGKSILFQGPSLYKSSITGKLTIVVTPLKALMEDHVMSLWKLGFWNSVEFINQDKGMEIQDIYRKIAGGELLMVFVAPERFRTKSFMNALKQRIKIDGNLEYLVFDEAHCISQWGSEFRPDYYYCTKKVKELKKHADFPLLMLSATITNQVTISLKKALY